MSDFSKVRRGAVIAGLCLTLGALPVGAAEAEEASTGGGLFSGGPAAGSLQMGVNSFLWRASLDTLSFMPLASVDPFGGVIITDWYANPSAPNERFKMTVYVLDKRLRADGLKVAVFRQTRGGAGWTDAPADPQTAATLENAILTRARQLKIGTGEE